MGKRGRIYFVSSNVVQILDVENLVDYKYFILFFNQNIYYYDDCKYFFTQIYQSPNLKALLIFLKKQQKSN